MSYVIFEEAPPRRGFRGQLIQFFMLINVVGVVFRNSAPEGRNLHLKVEDSPALRLKASNGKNRNKCAKEEERRRKG